MPPDDVVRLLFSVALLLAAAVAGGAVSRRLGAPSVLGELAAGVVLGPTVLGRTAPALYASLFPSRGPVATGRQALVMAGLLGFLFVAGLEIDLAPLRRRMVAVASVSASGIAVPFAIGATAVVWRPGFFGHTLEPGLLALFLGTALSISALPVIARTFMDLGLQHTTLAGVVLSAAIIDDLVGWSLFALIARDAHGTQTKSAFGALVLAAGMIAFALTAGRAAVTLARPWLRRQLPAVAPRLALAASLVFCAAAAAEYIGVHAVFGGFLAGVALSQGRHREDVHAICHAFGTGVLAPLYFASVGLKTDFAGHFDPVLCAVVLIIACAGKIGGAAVAGRLAGFTTREALAMGAALNARGAMEILLAGVALEQALIDERLFVALVAMALATSLMSAPLLSRLVTATTLDGTRATTAIPATTS